MKVSAHRAFNMVKELAYERVSCSEAEKLAAHKEQGLTVFSGADAFLLSDTYGFPIDLTIEMVEDEGMTVDMEKFTACREEQRVRARKAREALGDLGWAGIDFGSDVTATEFVGYEEYNCEANPSNITLQSKI